MTTVHDKRESLMFAAKARACLVQADGLHSMTRAGQHMDADGRLFFYATLEDEVYESVSVAAKEFGASTNVLASIPSVDECLNCGNIADKPVAVCPNCNFRETAACPFCRSDVAREDYLGREAGLFSCPACGNKVRLTFADPLWDPEGKYNEPIVLVRAPSEPT